MAFNPPIFPNGVPSLIEGDRPILQVRQINFDITLDNGRRYNGKGDLYLSSFRLVFVVMPLSYSEFRAFDIPLAHVSSEQLTGTETIQGRVQPLYNYMSCPASFRIQLHSAQSKAIIQPFFEALRAMRSKGARNNPPPMQPPPSDVAFIDPEDPSIIFIQEKPKS